MGYRFRLGIRPKLFMGFSIITAMLVISDALSILEISRIGKQVRRLLSDSYQSVQYCQNMLQAFEGQRYALLENLGADSARRIELRKAFEQASTRFKFNMALAKTNLTHESEDLLIDSIERYHAAYLQQGYMLLERPQPSLQHYLELRRGPSTQLYGAVNRLLAINQEALYKGSTLLEKSPQQAMRPALIVIVVACLFTFMFTHLISHYYVSPIIHITEAIRQHLKFGRYRPPQTNSHDEIQDLREAIDQLVEAHQEERKKR
ncbi:MAG: hypothetical protein AL399_07555 [Candidatus [Bacteroides] periocalifornicus]|uniref:Chemotaxis methyl-accepting receptor HlyB-like 4HB MCP domain-containing protein n=1 Tax=Candidatus [Bacteroides] periocalifornicus TaxID=1702214 RepID=A0A0Q4B5S8_9BACT|nr:MAG: hypothetical protein AL399_07555 [Candidatus [Bacteroides] periocalifornicus]